MKKLKIPTNLTTLAYDSIREYILQGRLDETARLTEEFLSTQLGISKSPIREALNRLEAEGLIRIEPRKGAFLRRLSGVEMSQLYDLREALEAHVVRTGSLTPSLLVDLRQSLERQQMLLAAGDRAQYIEEDMHFHATLAKATGNDHLCAVLENVQNQIWLSRRTTYDLSPSTAPREHHAILEALEQGERDRAESAMRDHIRKVKERLLKVFPTEAAAEAASSI